MKRISVLSILLALAAFATGASAQQYPNRNISMIVPYAAGGLPDTMTRIMGVRMAESPASTSVVADSFK